MARHIYDVIVGNIGTVYHGGSFKTAMANYMEYVSQSKTGYGRAAGEQIALMKDNDIHIEYDPRFPRMLTWQDLFDVIQKMTPEQKHQNAQFFVPAEDAGPVQVQVMYQVSDLILQPNKIEGPVARLETTDNF